MVQRRGIEPQSPAYKADVFAIGEPTKIPCRNLCWFSNFDFGLLITDYYY